MDYSQTVPGVRVAAKKPLSRIAGFFAANGSIGAICESSRFLAKRMAKAIEGIDQPILELGAGYGSVTVALPESTISIEREAERFTYLRHTFPNRNIIDTCAIAFLDELTQPTVVVSSIPNVNNPEFALLRDSVARAYKAGTVTTLITYTYFPRNPFTGIFPKSEVVGLELLNVPPAFVWRYSC